jgi:hypothetical protein
MDFNIHFLIKLEAFRTEASKSTPFTASAAMMEENMSPVPERSVPTLWVFKNLSVLPSSYT